MATSTRLGPWLLGTVREGAGRNLGAATVSQEVQINFPVAGELPFAQLPAGACLENLRIFSVATVASGGGAIPISLTPTGGALIQIGTLTFVATTAGAAAVTTYQLGNGIAATPAGAPLWQNIGLLDARLSLNTGLPAGVIWYVSVNYTVRNQNGTILRLP